MEQEADKNWRSAALVNNERRRTGIWLFSGTWASRGSLLPACSNIFTVFSPHCREWLPRRAFARPAGSGHQAVIQRYPKIRDPDRSLFIEIYCMHRERISLKNCAPDLSAVSQMYTEHAYGLNSAGVLMVIPDS